MTATGRLLLNKSSWTEEEVEISVCSCATRNDGASPHTSFCNSTAYGPHPQSSKSAERSCLEWAVISILMSRACHNRGRLSKIGTACYRLRFGQSVCMRSNDRRQDGASTSNVLLLFVYQVNTVNSTRPCRHPRKISSAISTPNLFFRVSSDPDS